MKIKYIPTNDERNIHLNDKIQKYFPSAVDESNPDLIIVIGGDGALLHAIQKYNKLQVPFFGIAGGTLNFLMNPVDDLIKLLTDLIKNKQEITTIDTTSIKVTLKQQQNTQKLLGYAINDVVIGSTIMGYHNFILNSEDRAFSDFSISGSGISISTDLGSTGYNFNLGGPVLPLGSKMWSVKGVVCNRYLEDIVPIQKIHITCAWGRTKAGVYLDGIHNPQELNQNDEVILSKGQKIKIAFLEKKDFISRRLEIASRYRKH